MMKTNLTLRLAHGGDKLKLRLACGGDKPMLRLALVEDIEICSWCRQTLHGDLPMADANITLCHGEDKPYTETCPC